MRAWRGVLVSDDVNRKVYILLSLTHCRRKEPGVIGQEQDAERELAFVRRPSVLGVVAPGIDGVSIGTSASPVLKVAVQLIGGSLVREPAHLVAALNLCFIYTFFCCKSSMEINTREINPEH